VPVVASDVGGIPEVVVDGVTGLLVHYDEKDTTTFEKDLAIALTSVLENPSQSNAMGVAGFNRDAKDFGWDRIAQQTIDIYQSLLK
jgi:starch synthase